MGKSSRDDASNQGDTSFQRAASINIENYSSTKQSQQLSINGLQLLADRHGFKQSLDQLELNIKNGIIYLGINQDNQSGSFKNKSKLSNRASANESMMKSVENSEI